MSRVHTLDDGRTIHIGGRRRPLQTRATHPHLFKGLRSYVVKDLPPAPDYDYTTGNMAALADVLGNDVLGDCTSAGAAHIIEAMTGMVAAPVTITRDQAVAFYAKSTGYVPGNPATDNGGDEIQVCTVWQQQGYLADGSHKIAGWVAIEDFDPDWIKRVGHLFPLYFGVELADPWTKVGGPGFVWDVGAPPNPNNGHCFVGLGGNAQGIVVNSWGMRGLITYAAMAQFCADSAGGNVFAILTQDAIDNATKLCPAGIDWATLQGDLASLGAAPSPDSYPTVGP